jgi:hypothetical protein
MASRSDLWMSSRSDRREEARKQGDARRTYRILGKDTAFLKRHKASWECSNFSLSPRRSRVFFFAARTAMMLCGPPIGAPRRQASEGLVYWSCGDTSRNAHFVSYIYTYIYIYISVVVMVISNCNQL